MLITVADCNQRLQRKLENRLLEEPIRIAELKYIKRFLGETFYDTLVNEKDTQSYTGLNKTLLTDYIEPALAYYALHLATIYNKAEMTSNGFQSLVSGGGNQVSDKDYAAQRQHFLSIAELYIEQAEDYLTKNSSSFPNWDCGERIQGATQPYIY